MNERAASASHPLPRPFVSSHALQGLPLWQFSIQLVFFGWIPLPFSTAQYLLQLIPLLGQIKGQTLLLLRCKRDRRTRQQCHQLIGGVQQFVIGIRLFLAGKGHLLHSPTYHNILDLNGHRGALLMIVIASICTYIQYCKYPQHVGMHRQPLLGWRRPVHSGKHVFSKGGVQRGKTGQAF